MGEDGFWNNQEAAKPVIAELKLLKSQIDPLDALLKSIDDVRALYELAEEAGDADSLAEADKMLADLETKGEPPELQALLGGKNDPLNAFFQIHAGAGGTEAQDWAEMLLRMYLYYFEKRGWDVSEVDRQWGEQAGIKGAERMLRRSTMPTALFAANDLVAVGAIDRLEQDGARVPEDVSVVGYDNTFVAALNHLSITTINQPRHAMGRDALALLLERVDGRDKRSVKLHEPSLVVRKTTAPPR